MIYIKKVQRVNPKDPEGLKIYVWTVVTVGTVTLNVLAQRVANRSGHSVGACLGIIEDAVEAIVNFMESGYNVEMDDLGRFQLKVSSQGYQKADEVSTNAFRRKYVHYQPVGSVKAAFEAPNIREGHSIESATSRLS